MRRNLQEFIFFISIITLASCSQATAVHKEDAALLSDESVVATESTESILAKEEIKIQPDLLPHNVSEDRQELITHIVLHFMSNAGITPENPYNLEALRSNFSDYGVSTHYVIGREGEIYQWVKEGRVAYHAGAGNLELFPEYEDRLNHHSIGIEMMAIGTEEEMSTMMDTANYELIAASDIGYTKAQYEAVEKLIDAIIRSNPLIQRDRTHIVGHDEYAPDRKVDPGSLFDWERIGF